MKTTYCKVAIGLSILLLLNSCSLFQPLSSERQTISEEAYQRLGLPGDPAIAEYSTANCDANKLTLTTAMRLTLQCNPEVQIALSRLDITAAELNQEIRIDNPSLALAVRASDTESGVNIELDLLAPVLDLILFPTRKSAAKARINHAQQQALATILRLTTALETNWYKWQVANLKVDIGTYYAQTRTLTLELARRYHAAGNINQKMLSQLQIAAGKSNLYLDRLTLQRAAIHIELQRLMGLQRLPTLQSTLRILPASDPSIATIWQMSQKRHPLLQAATASTTSLSRSLALERQFRFLLDFNAGLSLEQEGDGETVIGPAIELELPLFNQNQAEIALASSQLETAIQQRRVLDNQFYSEIRLALGQMQLARQRLQRYRNTLLPAYHAVMQQTQLEYNFMLSSAFDLLETRAEQFDILLGFVDDIGSYWQGVAQLKRLSGGTWAPSVTPELRLRHIVEATSINDSRTLNTNNVSGEQHVSHTP